MFIFSYLVIFTFNHILLENTCMPWEAPGIYEALNVCGPIHSPLDLVEDI